MVLPRFTEPENVDEFILSPNFYLCCNTNLDGGKSKGDCGDEATQFGGRKSENTGGSKRKVLFLGCLYKVDLVSLSS